MRHPQLALPVLAHRIILRGMSIAISARHSFYGLIAMAVTALLGMQTFIIIGGVIKLIPLGLMAVVGLIYGIVTGTLQNNMTVSAQVETVAENPLFVAVCATAFAYEGWIIATSINSEIKDSKKNLPKALIIGGIIIIVTYIAYYIGVAGGASNQELIKGGTTVAFTNIFGRVLGNILKLFVAISCIGTMNGLMMASCRRHAATKPSCAPATASAMVATRDASAPSRASSLP